jgi:hypothetical protein
MPEHSWPVQPYRGFSYYTRDDAPLFAGREEDTFRCARFLADCYTRILILHGSTGCGKSSFLRAGLIPFLERGDLGFRFIKSVAGQLPRAVFVRSTEAPLRRLSECLFDFIARPLEDMTPRGQKTIILAEKISRHPDRASFCDNVSSNIEAMLEVLHKVAKAIPQTLVIIIDQAEEVLTLKPGPNGHEFRARFFDFLTSFKERNLDIKLLISIRTEYIGRFDNEIQNRTGEIVAIPHYLLTDLSESRMTEAIERPTSQKDIEGFGSPFAHYKFSYEEGLPQRIAQDLIAANPKGGTLPVLQIVCERLYRSINSKIQQPNNEMVIRSEDYVRLGGIEGQVEAYVSELLGSFCIQHGISRDLAVKKEIERWKHVLYLLTKEQVDGTATTEIKSKDEIRAEAARRFCELDFDLTLDYLSAEDQRILRREEITNVANKQPIICYSLGHDAIGLALYKWRIADEESHVYRNRIVRGFKTFGRYVALTIGFIYLAMACSYFIWGIFKLFGDHSDDVMSLGMIWFITLISALLSWLFFYLSGFSPKIRMVSGSLWRRGGHILRLH